MRITAGLIVIEFPTAWARDTDEYFSKGTAADDAYRATRGAHRLRPHAPYTVSDDALQRVSALAEEVPHVPIQMHLHETAREIDEALTASGERPLRRRSGSGLLPPVSASGAHDRARRERYRAGRRARRARDRLPQLEPEARERFLSRARLAGCRGERGVRHRWRGQQQPPGPVERDADRGLARQGPGR